MNDKIVFDYETKIILRSYRQFLSLFCREFNKLLQVHYETTDTERDKIERGWEIGFYNLIRRIKFFHFAMFV